jgi:wobble nucleotide-excising tRNase
LVNHYRAYFSDAYDSHLAKITSLRSTLRTTLSGDSLATFEREFQSARENAAFWSRFIEVPEVELDTEAIASAWSALRDALDQALVLKHARPLDVFGLEPAAANAYDRFSRLAETVRAASNRLLECQPAIDAAKEEAGQGSLSAAQSQLNTLLATKERFTPEVNSVCTALLEAKRRKTEAEAKKGQARQALAEQRERVFGTYQTTLNQFLLKLNAEFSVESLEPSDRGRGGPPSTGYYLKVNDSRVRLEPSRDPGPSFGTVLSSGDRNTLALAFFFATLEHRDLSNAIVVVDDPASSLDDGRQVKTIQRISDLFGKAHQLIVLSHRERILARILNKANRDQTASIKIEPCGPHESTLSEWDADAASENDHDRLFASVQAYTTSHEGEKQQVAQDLRLLLESFLRNSFPDHYEPGKPIGHFVQHCKNALAAGTPVLSEERIAEIDDFLEYANLFHHSTNQTSWRDALSNVNETELHSHARDCIALIKKMRGTP